MGDPPRSRGERDLTGRETLVEGVSHLIGRRWAWVGPGVLAAAMLLVGIGNHPFWSDEADTAIFARNTLHFGYPTGWDGRNLFAYRDGALLSPDLVESQSTWLQYYLAAGAFALLGEGTVPGRLPFAALGVATVIAFYFLVLRWYGSRRLAFACATALAVWVPFLLFARACRYYAPSMLASVVLTLLWDGLSLRRGRGLVLFVGVGVLMFHTNPLLLACLLAALLLTDLLLERHHERFRATLVASAAIALLALPWALALAPAADPQGRFMGNLEPWRWLRLFARHLRDYSTGGFFPGLMVLPVAISILAAAHDRDELRRAARPAVLVLAYTATLALLSPQDPRTTWFADIRYCVPMIPVLLVLLVHGLVWLVGRQRVVGVAVAVLCLGTDLLAPGWLVPAGSDAVRSASPLGLPFHCWPAEYLHECTHHYQTPYAAVVAYLRDTARHDETIVVSPPYKGDAVLFYLGDRLRFVSVLRPDNLRLMPRVRASLPRSVYGAVRPDWIVAFGQLALEEACSAPAVAGRSGYRLTVLPHYDQETTRAELFWRSFGPVTAYPPEERIFILHSNGEP
jgi:hypothetical protein